MLEVITPAETFDLTTLANVKAEFSSIADDSEDANLSRWITAASDSVSRYCKRVFAFQTYAETFYVSQFKSELLLAQYPVAEVASVVENDLTLDEGAAEVHADTGALIRLIADRPGWWPLGKIVVTYSAGFADDTNGPTLPPAVERATTQLVGMFRFRVKRDPSVREVTLDDRRVTYGLGPLANGEGLPPEVAALLAPYRDYRVR
jgi:uncharacterized phiE125 gp8 family phage protein